MGKCTLEPKVNSVSLHATRRITRSLAKASSSNPSYLLDLPEVLLDRIVHQLPAVSQIAMSQTCKMLQQKMHDPLVLEKLEEHHKLLPPLLGKHLGLRDYFLSRMHAGRLGHVSLQESSEARRNEIAQRYVQRVLLARISLNLHRGTYTWIEIPTRISNSLRDFVFSPKGDKLVIVFWSRESVQFLDLTKNSPKLIELGGHRFGINSASFSPCGNRVVTASNDSTARVWDITTNPPTWIELKWPSKEITSAVFSPNGNQVATVAYYKEIRIWDISTNPPTWIYVGDKSRDAYFTSFCSAGDRMMTCSFMWFYNADRGDYNTYEMDYKAYLWDLTAIPLTSVELSGHKSFLRSAVFSPVGDKVMTYSLDYTARIWNITTTPPTYIELGGHRGGILSASFSPKGDKVVTTSSDHTARIWDITAIQPTYVEIPMRWEDDPFRSVSFSPKGDHVFMISSEGRAMILDLITDRPELIWKHEGRVFLENSFSPGGYLFAVYKQNPQTVQIVDFSSDGNHLCNFLSCRNL